MIIWALVGAVGMLSGMVSVGMARRRNQPAEPSASPQPAAAVDPVAADRVAHVQETQMTSEDVTTAA